MKRKIVIKVQMACEKCKAKVMCIGAFAEGVISLAVEGADKDRLVVIGEDVDSAKLICKLKKKICCSVTLLSDEVVKPTPPPTPKPKPKPTPPPPPPPPPECSCNFQFFICHCHQYPNVPKSCEAVCYPNPCYCSIQWWNYSDCRKNL